MVNAAMFLSAMRERLAKLNDTDRNDRDISEMRALSELINAIDDGDLIQWEHKGIQLLENAVAAYRPNEIKPAGTKGGARRAAVPCPKEVLRQRHRPTRPRVTH